jgi:hypothetical protein
MQIKENNILLNGDGFVSPSAKEVWGSKICTNSI